MLETLQYALRQADVAICTPSSRLMCKDFYRIWRFHSNQFHIKTFHGDCRDITWHHVDFSDFSHCTQTVPISRSFTHT